ncbi:GNAT family N-acetyltransferase [Saccharothrix longispora]|uniref:GNAT superfamily N-acetyltransferase n=1 Tax=Saccharothrix longispora TaxID=33920 RepID=A0ABU1PTM0_9PSEU|nr:GNAT family N-acetyltransferase [Saccharothrix longispora]MDR6593987.1 GNAT superfamily N-acetyltransferase [Saccharothrix longispora]
MGTAEAPTITRSPSVTDDLVRDVAALTRAAYAAGDLVPGLPVADGAREVEADVRADLDAGHLLWTATVAGRPAGSVRALPGARAWSVRRLAVSPDHRHLGLGRLLLRAVEAAAAEAGAARVTLDAVVERGNPAFYARAGYLTTRHFAAPDKPLSEVTMERALDEPPPPPEHPDPTDLATSPPGVVRSWWSVGGHAVRVVGAGEDGVAAELARHGRLVPERAVLRGVDRAPLIGDAPDRARVEHLPAPVDLVPAYALPRCADPASLAWWRFPPARG